MFVSMGKVSFKEKLERELLVLFIGKVFGILRFVENFLNLIKFKRQREEERTSFNSAMRMRIKWVKLE
jgi:hypothetical protein